MVVVGEARHAEDPLRQEAPVAEIKIVRETNHAAPRINSGARALVMKAGRVVEENDRVAPPPEVGGLAVEDGNRLDKREPADVRGRPRLVFTQTAAEMQQPLRFRRTDCGE